MHPVKFAWSPGQAHLRVRVWLVKCTTNWRGTHHTGYRALPASSGWSEMDAQGRISSGVRGEPRESRLLQACRGVYAK